MSQFCGPDGCVEWAWAALPWWAVPVIFIIFVITTVFAIEMLAQTVNLWEEYKLKTRGPTPKQKPYVMKGHFRDHAPPKSRVSTRRWPPTWLKK